MSIKINDLEIARFCYAKVKGIDIRELEGKELSRKDKEVSFGENKPDGTPLWAASVYKVSENDCRLDLALNVKGLFSPKTFRRMAYVVFDYIFNQCQLARCTTTVRESNKASIRITKAFGLKIEGIKRNSYQNPTENMVVFGMLKEECPWLGESQNE